MSFILLLALLWFFYYRKPTPLLFIALVALGLAFKLHFLPGYFPYYFTPNFAIGLENPLLGLFPLALLVPLARNRQDWTAVLKGFGWGCVGIGILALLATVAGVAHWNFKLPSFFGERILSNLILTSIPEEGFYRGFIQATLYNWMGKGFALILTSLLFALSHLYWSPNVGVLAFTFLAGLLYGGVYLYSKRIESAIFTHLLLNLLHMIFFSYHAM